MVRHYAALRLLLAGFFLYFAWPYIPEASSQLESIFWGVWLVLFLFAFGANLAVLLQMTKPPVMEQEHVRERQTLNH